MKRLIAPLAALFAFVGIAFAQPTAPPKLSTATAPHVVWIGDSITANSNFITDNVVAEQLNGYTTWTKLLTGYRINTQLQFDNFAVGGYTTGQMLAELPAAIARKPDVCVVHGGRNDSGGYAPMPDTKIGTSTYNLRQIYDKLQAENCVVFAIKVLSNNTFLDLTAKQRSLQINQWIETQKLTRKGFYVIDAGATFDDPANTTAWAPRLHYVEDGTHPSIWGAYALGKQLADQINTLWPDWRLRLQNVDDVYSATNNPTGDILTTHMFVGAGGTLAGGATGAVAAGWTLNAALAPNGATVAGSQTTTTDGRQAQTVTIGGTASLGVTAATVGTPGTGGTGSGIVTVVGGTGTPATLNVTVVAGGMTAVTSVATPGAYTVFPTSPAAVTGLSLTGATVNLTSSSLANRRVLLSQLIDVANLSQGDTIECSIDANWGATNNITSAQLILSTNQGPGKFMFSGVGQSGAANTTLGYTLPTNVGGPVASLSVPLYTPYRRIEGQPTNTGGQSQLLLQMDFVNPLTAGATLAGTFQFASPSCRKILPVSAP